MLEPHGFHLSQINNVTKNEFSRRSTSAHICPSRPLHLPPKHHTKNLSHEYLLHAKLEKIERQCKSESDMYGGQFGVAHTASQIWNCAPNPHMPLSAMVVASDVTRWVGSKPALADPLLQPKAPRHYSRARLCLSLSNLFRSFFIPLEAAHAPWDPPCLLNSNVHACDSHRQFLPAFSQELFRHDICI